MQLSLPFGESEEILLFDDAIGVNRQKEFREKGYEKTLKRVQTDVIEVQRPKKLTDWRDLREDLGLQVASQVAVPPVQKHFDYITGMV